MLNLPSVNVHDFSMVPRADIPRSRFDRESDYKTTLDAGYLVPFYIDEYVPGDHFDVDTSLVGRLITPIVPIMDNVWIDVFYFSVPNRLVYDNWQKLQGERRNPSDSIDYLVPQIVSPAGGYALHSVFDYFGLPTVGVLTAGLTVSHSALPLRAYNLIYNEWFRDQNLIDSVPSNFGDGPDLYTDYVLLRRGKRHDYFTSCLPWAQKGNPVTLSLGTTADVTFTSGLRWQPSVYSAASGGTNYGALSRIADNGSPSNSNITAGVNAGHNDSSTGTPSAAFLNFPAGVVGTANLSTATAQTINAIRLAVQTQRLLERDARGGTRYTEIIQAHFGVISPDARLQRPEYLGGGTFPLRMVQVPQTSSTDATTPQGNLAAFGFFEQRNIGFRQAFTEHGHIIGLVSIRADLTYDRGMRRLWSRRTRYDFYMPVFAHLGEQPVLNKEIYITGNTAQDDAVFGWQERWADMRYMPSMLTGLMRNTAAGTLNIWHLSQSLTSLPTLNKAFIEENPPINRISAVPSPTGKQFFVDIFTRNRSTRPMPMYSTPGLMDHF